MKDGRIQKICAVAGVCLLIGAIAVFLLWQWQVSRAAGQATAYADTIIALIPAPESAVAEPRRDNAMPVLAIDGADFVGLIEMPQYGAKLPVGEGAALGYPYRMGGSVYDGTMWIYACAQKGQFDFSDALSLGDALYFTDMEGNRYVYEITAMRRDKQADAAALTHEPAALVLAIRNPFPSEYLIVFCNPA